MLSATTSNNHSLFSFGGWHGASDDVDDTTSSSFDFLPSVSFDDLQSSLESASFSFRTSHFRSPLGDGTVLGSPNRMDRIDRTADRSSLAQNGASATRTTRTGSIIRRPSTLNRQASVSSTASTSSAVHNNPPTAPAAVRGQRQNLYPPVSTSNMAKPPRDSLGSGAMGAQLELQNRLGSRRPSVASASDRGGRDSTRSSDDGGSRVFEGPQRSLTSSRASKAKLVSPPLRVGQTAWAADRTPFQTPDPQRASVALSKSPRTSAQRLKPPGSSGKRMSVMGSFPHASHVTGLGARTISPTDTIRLRRLSTMPPTRSAHAPNPPPPSLAEPRSSSRSPSMIHPTAPTPSSSRTTPDVNRKSYSSGFSIASINSANTVRTSTGSLQLRIPQSATTPRLPAPKPAALSSTASGGEEEETVPPVPAIPKAYESPKVSPGETRFPDKRRATLAFDGRRIKTSSTGSIPGPPHEALAKMQRKPSNRKSIASANLDMDKKPTGGPAKRHHLQPLRLPPITLGPLSTPTAAKIAALHHQASLDSDLSPPDRRQAPKTPRAASKSISSSPRRAHDNEDLASLRSTGSMHHASTDSPVAPDLTSSAEMLSAGALQLGADRQRRPGMSPYLSSSLPKGGLLDAAMLPRSTTGADYMLPLDLSMPELPPPPPQRKPSGPRAPPPRSVRAVPADTKSPSSSSPEEAPNLSSMSTLRRKLSLSWKRGQSKNGSRHEHEAQHRASMPPPKLPVSANVPHVNAPRRPPSPSDSNKPNGTGSCIDKGRRKSAASSLSAEQNRADMTSAKKEVGLDTVAEASAPHIPNLSVMSKMLRSKSSVSAIRACDVRTAELDGEDMVAEEEMRRLGSRRKETELAARTLDALRTRASAKERVSPQFAVGLGGASLNIYECGEIVDFHDVYFCGTEKAAKVVGDVQTDLPNFGYDDERGDYTIVPGDHLAYQYEIIDLLGKGSFGQVVRCIDHKTGALVAVKIIRNKKRFHQQALVEVDILQRLREWDPRNKHGMISFTHSFYFRGHLCIATELLDMNLYELIKANAFRGFSLKLIRRFTTQLLASLNLLRQHKVIHCDLKPENILLRHPLHAEIKVIDFGSSCFENEKVYTYIQSRFYRSPEVILGMTYGLPIDMWSLGCILAELYTGVPIFPGENEQEQLACIMELLGPPERHLIDKSTRKKIFFDSIGKPRLTVSSKGKRRRPSSKTLHQVLKCDDESFLDFLARCLRWDPDRRMKPDEANRHEFITGFKPSVPVPRSSIGVTRESVLAKRSSSSVPRPLPEPPAAAAKSNLLRPRDNTGMDGTSPRKIGRPSGRGALNASFLTHSYTTGGLGGVIGPKRTSTGALAMGSLAVSTSAVTSHNATHRGTSLPRASMMATRSASGRQQPQQQQDTTATFAAAGATAAMSRRRA